MSGGKDSVVLLDIMLDLREVYHFDFQIFHINYNMHNNSKIMFKYCKDLAKKNSIKIFYKEIESIKLFKNKNIESKAREFRYQELNNICIKNNIPYALTAHHEDDQIETIYMCEKNKSSWVSKIGIRDKKYINQKNKKNLLLRPLINISKKEISKYATKNRLLFFDDLTNKDIRFLRNKIRINIENKINIIAFRKKYLKISETNKEKMKKLKFNIKQFSSELIYFSKRNDFVIINRNELLNKNYDFIFFFFKKILLNSFSFNEILSSKNWKNLNLFLSSKNLGKLFELPKNIFISQTNNKIYIFKTLNNKTIFNNKNITGNYILRTGIISALVSNNNIYFKKNNGISIPFDEINKLKLEYWNKGDKYISNEKKTLKVSDVFINNKLSFFEKHNYPIVKISNKIIWIPEFFSKKSYSKNGPYIVLKWNSIL